MSAPPPPAYPPSIKRVRMNMPPPFAHASSTAKNSKELPWWKKADVQHTMSVRIPKNLPQVAAPDPNDMDYEYDVAMYEGDTVKELKDYLANGNVDCSAWSSKTFSELQAQIDDGKCELGLDENGNAIRVASVAKIFIYDENTGLLLFNPVNSFESHGFTSTTKKANKINMEKFQNAVTQAQGRKMKKEMTYEGIANPLMYGNNRSKSENVEIPSSMVFETTFSPFRETPRDAAARVMAWRFSLKMMTGRIFSTNVPMVEKNYNSAHFPGLQSEYHVHHVKLNPEFIVPLQKAISITTVTPMILNAATNNGINTHWYCWLNAKASAPELVASLRELYGTNPKVQTLIGDADFSGEMAQAVGQFLKEEAELLNNFK